MGAVPLIAVAVLASATGFNAGALGLTAGAAAALLTRFCRPCARWSLAAILVAGVLAAPWLPRTVLQPDRMSELSAVPTQDMPRLYIWAFAAERIAERPLLGWGMNASREVPGGKGEIVDNIRSRTYGEVMPLHPHNAALQAWLEMGLVGALLAAALGVRIVLMTTQPALEPRRAAAATGLVVTALVQFALSYGAWQSWWLASIFLAVAFLVIAARGGEAGPDPSLSSRSA
jgi:O-antigen ligase